MPRNVFKIAGAVLIATAGAAFADVTNVVCEGFIVTLDEETTMRAQENLGSGAAFESAVCDAASQLPIDEYKDPTRVNVRVMPADIELVVMVQQTSPDTN